MIDHKTWQTIADRGIYATNVEKIKDIYDIAQAAQAVPGEVAEVGVAFGCSAYVLGTVLKGKPLHLFDTFTGVTRRVEGEVAEGTFSAVDVNDVAKFLAKFNPTVYKGTFPDTFCLHDRKFSFVHSDTDTAYGTYHSLGLFWPRMSPGGIIVVDDYGSDHCPWIAKVCRAFGNHYGVNYEVHTASEHVIFRKGC